MLHGFGCPVPDCTRVRMDTTKKLKTKYKEKQYHLEREEEWKEYRKTERTEEYYMPIIYSITQKEAGQ
jgi:hypothetical protein